ncbi:EF-hand domain-containing protein [Pelagicoccus sp. SDUM812005]|uniref:EF-hand domain-containing protein n=1 Tax=Pelagicoccus sp. SDUM812005 TaxID=3041257 RepID=UPI00280ED1D0|nr:EF-hand domain-containing protein [Pelagicoccus sp. SDUM812005]MDQ8182471.1 EF-hand domain-containing protein [Pelagicoccus sp. SDUM812005]
MNTQLLALSIASATLFVANLSARPEGAPPRPDPEAIAVDMFADYDTDESNTLSQTELTAALTGLREKHQGERPRMGRKGSGDESDSDRPAKARQGKRKGPPSPEELAPKLVEDFDASGDGELDTEELLNALSSMHQRGRRGPAPSDSEAAE